MEAYMNQKLVNVDWHAAKGRIDALKEQAITKVASHAHSTRSFLSDKLNNTKSVAVEKIADRGISLTRKQLHALERLKDRFSH